MDLSIVIPVFNSEKTIAGLVESLLRELQQAYAMEIILVNDASRDRSDAVCRELFLRFRDHVRYFLLTENVGEYNAVRAGLSKANGNYVVVMDDDGQNPPREVSKLIEAITTSGDDVVYSVTVRRHQSLARQLASWLSNRAAALLFPKPSGLYLASFKIMRRELVRRILAVSPAVPYFDFSILQMTKRIGQVKVEYEPRAFGRSGYTSGKLFALWAGSLVPIKRPAYVIQEALEAANRRPEREQV